MKKDIAALATLILLTACSETDRIEAIESPLPPQGERENELTELKGQLPEANQSEKPIELFESGLKSSEGYVLNSGTKVGHWTYWNESREKKSEGTYKNGQRTGLWALWHDNGQKWAAGEFRNGQEAGPWTLWHDNAQKESEGEFKNGKREGLWASWHDNGQMATKGSYENGERQGEWTEWDKAGSINTEESGTYIWGARLVPDTPREGIGFINRISMGDAPGGRYGGRFDGRRDLRTEGGSGTEQARKDGLEWLANHQDGDGKWDCDGFMKHDPATDICEGPGRADHDVGVTGLSLLAFMGDGHTTRRGSYKEVVTKAVKWLRQQQDPESGLIGENSNTSFLYDHSIATLAMCEAYYFSKSPILASSAQRASRYIGQARNPYGVWRFAASPMGDNDTSITGWMIFALKSAEEGLLKVNSAAFTGAINWLDEVSDPVTGRVGYSSIGKPSFRQAGLNEEYPRDSTEAMTAVGLLCRFFLKQDPDKEDMMKKHADLMLKVLPEWDAEEGLSNDLYYWYYGTYAMYQMGGKHWTTWNEAMKAAILGSQEKSGSAKGSWDPNGPWGMVGGRVYSTALCVLCLEVYFRYAKVIGTR